MFKNHEIKIINGEEVLLLYLDLNTEFAKTTATKKTTINNEAKKYIANNNIDFKGKKVIIMLGGIIASTLLLTTSNSQISFNTPNTPFTYSTNIISYNDPSTLTEPITTDIANEKQPKTEITNNNTNNAPINNQNTSTPKTKSSSNKNIENKPQTPSNNNIKTNTTNQETPTTPVNQPINDKENTNTTTYNQTTENKQMVTIKRSNGNIITIELEEYLIGVVGAEMPASFNIEALKAQAIAARTYTLKSIQDNVTLTDTVKTQVYKDNNELASIWGSSYNTYYQKIKNAVNSTTGLVMTYNGSLINAYYHSTSNGKTEDASFVFGSYPYLKSVDSHVDENVSSFLRTINLSYEEISNKLNIPVTNESTIAINRNNSNRVNEIIIDNNLYNGVAFRTKLGLRSTDFDITLNENDISITTRGYGHGVGMSQYGANEYARLGWSYENILKHYYTSISITNI